MKRLSVESSNIASIGWDNEVLEIEFKRGGVYQYKHVTTEIHQAMMMSESKGKFFDQYIKPFYVKERIQ